MSKYLAAYAGTAVVMIVLDLIWLGVIAKPMYQQGIGHLLSERPNVAVAIAFYALYAAGVRQRPGSRSAGRRVESTQNSLPSGSARTTQEASP